MGRGGEHIVYDNNEPTNLTRYGLAGLFNTFRREEQFRIAQGQFRIAQGEIMSASGVSISIALTEGGGVWTDGGEGETHKKTELLCLH